MRVEVDGTHHADHRVRSQCTGLLLAKSKRMSDGKKHQKYRRSWGWKDSCFHVVGFRTVAVAVYYVRGLGQLHGLTAGHLKRMWVCNLRPRGLQSGKNGNGNYLYLLKQKSGAEAPRRSQPCLVALADRRKYSAARCSRCAVRRLFWCNRRPARLLCHAHGGHAGVWIRCIRRVCCGS